MTNQFETSPRCDFGVRGRFNLHYVLCLVVRHKLVDFRLKQESRRKRNFLLVLSFECRFDCCVANVSQRTHHVDRIVRS